MMSPNEQADTPWEEWYRHLGSLGGAYEHDAAARLFELAQGQAERWIIEVGVFRGFSALCMAAASLNRPEVQVLCVDSWVDTPGMIGPSGNWLASSEQMKDFLAAAANFNLLHKILPLRMLSAQAVAVWPQLAGKAGLIHLDATHTYMDLVADVRLWLPFLAPGGIVAIHDYHVNYPGVIQAVDEMRAGPWRRFSATDSCDWEDFRLTDSLAELRYMPSEVIT